MAERFYLQSPPAADQAELTGDEARHLARVLRARLGDVVTLFDGRGCEWPARVVAIDRDRVRLAVESPRLETAPARQVVIAAALPKGDRQKWMVEKLTELGATRLVPLATERGVAEATPAAIERLVRAAIEACKQCGRNTLLEIAPPRPLAALFADRDPAAVAVVGDPAGEPLGPLLSLHDGPILAIVGPEGGLSAAELAAAEAAGCRRVSLGPHILRVETAAVAFAAAGALSRHAAGR